ncbi:MAG: DUF2214 family protein [Pseudomonadota bacterium]
MTEVIIRTVHFLGIMVLASMLVGEHLLLKPRLGAEDIRRLAVIDAIYGLSALVVLGAGLSLWLWTGKPAAYYSGNPVFHAKLGAFVLLGLLSIYPTVFLLRQRKSPAAIIAVPARLIHIVRAELLVLLLLPVLAVLMAHGYGQG